MSIDISPPNPFEYHGHAICHIFMLKASPKFKRISTRLSILASYVLTIYEISLAY